jgi:ABC-type uncharacterized transport system ATPase subunit
MLEVINLQKHFEDFCAIKNLSFTIKSEQILRLIGQNGTGKHYLPFNFESFKQRNWKGSVEWGMI